MKKANKKRKRNHPMAHATLKQKWEYIKIHVLELLF